MPAAFRTVSDRLLHHLRQHGAYIYTSEDEETGRTHTTPTLWVGGRVAGSLTTALVDKMVRQRMLVDQIERGGTRLGQVRTYYTLATCENCDAAVPLDENYYCEECCNECELCGDRYPDNRMSTEHVCDTCGPATSTR